MKIPINLFDIALVGMLVAGVLRGRKRGLSEELVTMLHWASMLVVCALVYKPIGDWMASVSPLSRVFTYVASYITVAVLYSSLFMLVKRHIGGKLVGSDAFGKGEYYLGMPAGMVRFACITLFVLAIINARQYTQKEIADAAAYTEDVYGSNYFPGWYEVQTTIFEKSLTGPTIKKYSSFLLIEPTIHKDRRIKRPELELP